MVNRYLASDLSGVQLMTLSGTNFGTTPKSAFSDGTDLYVKLNADNNWARYTISGTTYTYVSTITYTSSGDTRLSGAMCDGTNVYMTSDLSGAMTIRKYAIAG